MTKNYLDYLSKRFGIPESDIVWFNAGICYSRIGVKTRESAEKVRKCVTGSTANGGMLDGMPLGGISEINYDGVTYYGVTC